MEHYKVACEVVLKTYQSPVLTIPLSTLLALNTITSILLNGTVLHAIWKTPSLQNPSHILIASLALADLLVGVVAQPAVLARNFLGMGSRSNQYYHTICTLANVCKSLNMWLISVSLYTCIIISIDRLLAIKLKTSYSSFVTVKRVLMITGFWWIFGGIFFNALIFVEKPSTPIFMVILSVGCGLFLLVISLLYLKSMMELRKLISSVRPIQEEAPNQTANLRPNFDVSKYRKTLKTMFLLFVTIIVFYFPSICASISLGLTKNLDSQTIQVFSRWMMLSELFLFLNSTSNPLLYLLRMGGLRKAAKVSLKKLVERFVTVS